MFVERIDPLKKEAEWRGRKWRGKEGRKEERPLGAPSDLTVSTPLCDVTGWSSPESGSRIISVASASSGFWNSIHIKREWVKEYPIIASQRGQQDGHVARGMPSADRAVGVGGTLRADRVPDKQTEPWWPVRSQLRAWIHSLESLPLSALTVFPPLLLPHLLIPQVLRRPTRKPEQEKGLELIPVSLYLAVKWKILHLRSWLSWAAIFSFFVFRQSINFFFFF